MKPYLYEIRFDPVKPFVSVTVPAIIEQTSAYKRADYKNILGAGFIMENKNLLTNLNPEDIPESEKTLTFYRNLSPEWIQRDINLFFQNLFETLDTLNKTIYEFRLSLLQVWEAEVKIGETQIIVSKLSYKDFKKHTLQAIEDVLNETEEISSEKVFS